MAPGRNGDRQRVGAEESLGAAPRRHAGPGVGHGYADAALLGCHQWIDAGGAYVVGVTHAGDPNAKGLGGLEGRRHGSGSGHVADTVVAIDGDRPGQPCLDADSGSGVIAALAQTDGIVRDAAQAMGREAAKVGLDQAARRDGGVVGFQPQANEKRRREGVERVEGIARLGRWHEQGSLMGRCIVGESHDPCQEPHSTSSSPPPFVLSSL